MSPRIEIIPIHDFSFGSRHRGGVDICAICADPQDKCVQRNQRRLQELSVEAASWEEGHHQRVQDLWDEMIGEFAAKNGLTDDQARDIFDEAK